MNNDQGCNDVLHPFYNVVLRSLFESVAFFDLKVQSVASQCNVQVVFIKKKKIVVVLLEKKCGNVW